MSTHDTPDVPGHTETQRTNHPQVGVGSGRHGWALSLFGLPFAGAGIGVIAANALGKLDVNRDTPPFVVYGIGAMFALVGLWLVVYGIRSWLLELRRDRDFAAHPDEPWRMDRWHPERAPDLLHNVLSSLAFAAFAAVFMLPFDYFVFFGDKQTPLFAKAMVGLFNLIPLGALTHALYSLGRRLKYGDGHLLLRSVPTLAPDPVEVTLRLPRQLHARCEQLTCTFRYCEQRMVRSGDSSVTRTYSYYEEVRTLGSSELHREVGLRFELPDDAPSTQLQGDTRRFYTLEVEAETPGIDYRALYLLPVYA